MSPAAVSLGAWTAFAELVGPALGVMLVIGLATGVLQTATQVREASVPFIVKLAGLAALTSVAGPWMMQGVEGYATHLFLAIPGLLHG
ncbi:MAG: flagellar biosynthesis protein FliQ [Rhodospirillales bacterium 20-64-7]|nr:MAG: flagellar biosynthesis protein FliQ [Rhodospirillales bacterium 20-64-7]